MGLSWLGESQRFTEPDGIGETRNVLRRNYDIKLKKWEQGWAG
jgi:hypothetical protein